MNRFQPWGLLAGRILLALIFVGSGIGKIGNFAGTAGYMARMGMPLTEVLLVGAILIEVLGGLALAAGFKTRWAALAIFLFMIPTTLIFHAFWAVPQDQAMGQMIHFQKNLAIMGGLLYAMCCGAGRYSLNRV